MIKVYRTAKRTNEKMSLVKGAAFVPKPEGLENERINVYKDITYQEIEGFGGAFTEASSNTLDRMPEKVRNEIINLYFNPVEGIGYTFCRTHINSCDFALGNYSYDDTPGDTELKDFSIERDRKSLIPMIKAAMNVNGADIKIFASPWSPPPWMKTTNKMNQGGKLIKAYYQTWADYIIKYIKEYEKEGIKLWGLTVQNEPAATQPWDSCTYTAEEERDFVRDNLGPALYKAGLKDLKVVFWDHNKESVLERAKVMLEDKEAAKYIWGIGVHFYSGEHFDILNGFMKLYPNKKIIGTENAVDFLPDKDRWCDGEAYAHDIIGDLNSGGHGWVDWNMVLDEMGGPNHVKNFCYAPIIADTVKGTYSFENTFFYMGHFSKFIRPGAKRILCTKFTEKLEVCGVINTDGSVVVVVMNKTAKKIKFNLVNDKEIIKLDSLPHSIMTIIY